jgi:OOP family OmpA-OmpF porin
MPGVNFKSESAELTDEAKPILEAMASNLVRENARVEVAGHTSNTGSESYNLNLSQERAESVMKYLKSEGVPAGNMTARGYGMSEPVADNATQDGRNANKRVELRYKK